jgi:hypothetical protein
MVSQYTATPFLLYRTPKLHPQNHPIGIEIDLCRLIIYHNVLGFYYRYPRQPINVTLHIKN